MKRIINIVTLFILSFVLFINSVFAYGYDLSINKYKEIVNRKRNNIDPHHRILKHCNPFFYILHSTAISHARCRIHHLCCRKYRKVITLCTAIPHQNSHQTGQSVSHQHINNQPRLCYFFLFYFQTPPIKS